MDTNKFDWIDFYEDLLDRICKLSDDNDIAAKKLYDIYKQGYVANYKFDDYEKVDPLTYIAIISKNLPRHKEHLKETFKINIFPETKNGIPSYNDQKHDYVYAKEIFPDKSRTDDSSDEVFNKLWNFARDINNEKIEESLFNDLIGYDGNNVPGISKIMFICKPRKYYSLDENMREYVKYKYDRRTNNDYAGFCEFQELCKNKFDNKEPYILSNEAYETKIENDRIARETNPYEYFINKKMSTEKLAAVAMSYDKDKVYSTDDIIATPFFKEVKNITQKKYQPTRPLKNSPEYFEDKGNRTFKLTDDGYEFALKQREKLDEEKSKMAIKTDNEGNTITQTTISSKQRADKPKLNQILYGPPGTGKTYNTVVEAIKILDKNLFAEYDSITNLEDKNKKYEELEKKFNKFKDFGQIEFVTFHQSYSYEEFVEGIKPYIPEWGEDNPEDVKYVGKDGIFKNICEIAQAKQYFDNNEFEEKYKNLLNKLEKNIIKLKNKRSDFGIRINRDKNLTILTGENLENETVGSITKEQIKYQTYTSSGRKGYLNAVTDYLCNTLKLKRKEQINTDKNYVLIIDEINRGNISKIFGELITLIEEDKRGKFKVRLPYSQAEFTVPENLYIIGTMNTSDRSIASVDIALRRRFTFKEMMPEIKLIPNKEIYGLNLRDIFKTLNNRISVLLDRDHQVGHSYFMNIENETDFERVWFDCITPLLNEYFYGDWEKLRALLGDASEQKKSFIKKINDVTFANNYTCDDDDKYDFSSEDDLKEGFGEALINAFGSKDKTQKGDDDSLKDTTQATVEKDTEE